MAAPAILIQVKTSFLLNAVKKNKAGNNEVNPKMDTLQKKLKDRNR